MTIKKSYRNAYTGREAVYTNLPYLFKYTAKRMTGWKYKPNENNIDWHSPIMLIDALNTPLLQELFSHG